MQSVPSIVDRAMSIRQRTKSGNDLEKKRFEPLTVRLQQTGENSAPKHYTLMSSRDQRRRGKKVSDFIYLLRKWKK